MSRILKEKTNKIFYLLIIKVLLSFIIMNTTINAKEKHTNSLINEESPYLLQHANNPVDWYAWNKEAFKKAKDEDKMIFLSIGYSTCHWCHVMEEESFEDKDVANILNKYFISIKVDREEMPHVDKYYQDVHNIVNKKSGGWPLTIILTPERKAFFAATYIPINSKYGIKGMLELLIDTKNEFETNKKRVYKISENIKKVLEENKYFKKEKKDLKKELINIFVEEVHKSFDYKYKGIGQRPKFPHASIIDTLLDIYSVYKNKKALILATSMLKAMGKGGINDQIEGGFYRYSVDEKWRIPHFEKMLYTNAELLSSYSKAYRITKDEFYKNIAEEIINFTKKRFFKDNLLYSASDADSFISFESKEKEEGIYFVFDYKEVEDFLKEKNYKEKEIENILEYFNISFEGNFDSGLSNAYLSKKVNKKKSKDLEKIKKDLKELRQRKPYPFIDNKILTSWNAMYISSLFEAKTISIKNANSAKTLLDSLVKNLYINETLYHQRLINKKPKVKALFEDYSFLIEALLKAYDFSLEKKYLKLAIKLNKEAIKKFYINKTWMMSDDAFKIEAGVYDRQYKSAQAQMIDNILKIAILDDNLELQELAKKSLKANSFLLASKPITTPWLLRTYMAYKKEYITIKAKKESLENKTYPSYPFLLKKINKEEKYLACKIGVCFAYGEEFKEIIKEIEKEIKTKNY